MKQECKLTCERAFPRESDHSMYIFLLLSLMVWMSASLASLREAKNNNPRVAFGCC